MSMPFRLPRTFLLAVGLVLLTSAALLHLHVGATAERGRIVFLRLTDKHWQLWMMDGEGRSPRQLTFSPVDKHSPSWCPGNDVVHFSTARGDSVLLELDTGEEHPQLPFVIGVEPPKDLKGDPLPFDVDVRQLLIDRGFDQFAVVTCGEGAQPPAEVTEVIGTDLLSEDVAIVVHRHFGRGLEPLYEINVTDLDGRAGLDTLRSNGESADVARVLSNDGVLAYVSDRSGGEEIWVSSRDEPPKRLTDLAAKVGNPFWSHDGRFLYFESDFDGTIQIYRARADGEAVELVSDGLAPSRGAVLSWSSEKEATR